MYCSVDDVAGGVLCNYMFGIYEQDCTSNKTHDTIGQAIEPHFEGI